MHCNYETIVVYVVILIPLPYVLDEHLISLYFWRIFVQAVYSQHLALAIRSIRMPEVICAPVLSHTVLVVCILALTWSSLRLQKDNAPKSST